MAFDLPTFFKRIPLFPQLFADDPITIPVAVSPTSGACYVPKNGDDFVDARIPWDVSIPDQPGWIVRRKVFKFKQDGTLEEIAFSFITAPLRLVIAKGVHGVDAAAKCLDVMAVVYLVEDVDPAVNPNPKRKVACVIQFRICGECPTTPPTP